LIASSVDYHLSVASVVFGGLLEEAEYLLEKGYHRAAAVLIGVALEESLKSRARAAGVEITKKDTLAPVICKLKSLQVGILTEVQAKRLEAVARLRNDAAHGGEFNYNSEDVTQVLQETQAVVDRILNAR
jgi:HEPN domain-containing protein